MTCTILVVALGVLLMAAGGYIAHLLDRKNQPNHKN